MRSKPVKLMVTLGPATKTESDLRRLKDKNVDFVRINMSHSSLDDLKYFIALAKKVDIPFVVDTEGSQIRTSNLSKDSISLKENDEIKIYNDELLGDEKKISLKPSGVISRLECGDMLYVDFNSLILRVSDISTLSDKGYITAIAVNGGTLGKNKGVVVDSAVDKDFNLDPLTSKDYQSIEIGLAEGVNYIAASFMRSAEFVDQVRSATKNKMKIISKIECLDALNNLDEIIDASDFLLFDRGDMSKEVSIEKIILLQKIILDRARKKNKKVFVATNLLETMVKSAKPTRAEVHDVIATVLDGAGGLTLSAETAIGKYPIECVNMINNLVKQAELVLDYDGSLDITNHNVNHIASLNDLLLKHEGSAMLIPPHGGKLVNRVLRNIPDQSYLSSLFKIKINDNIQMDVEQIAVGTFSPIEGFMNREDLSRVLDDMRLANGSVWTIPIILDVTKVQAEKISIGDDILLEGDDGFLAILHVDDKYPFDKKELVQKFYNTSSNDHPGVRWIESLNPILLGGKVDLIKRRQSNFQEHTLTPKQTRRLFAEKNWSSVVGFHTRNVIHRSHEFIQLKALVDNNCDGLFIHPIIGKKKPGDFNAKYIIASYNYMIRHFYPKAKVVFATFSTFSRYAGPREAVFTALCRQNFGCSHFIVGRDHTGVGDFYHPNASHQIFDQFPDLEIKIIKFDKIFYSKKMNNHVHEKEISEHHDEEDKMNISGTEARKMFELGKTPPSWFMRPEISNLIIEAIARGEEVFVKKDDEIDNTGKVIWLTGLSGSGKTTIASNLKLRLEAIGKKVVILDGDDVRSKLHKHLGFSREDIKENNNLVAKLAQEKIKHYDFVLVSMISPYRSDRDAARELIGSNFIELFINCPIEVCVKRDVKGLYKKALAGEINNFIGVAETNPYEPPINPDLELKTGIYDLDFCVNQAFDFFVKSK